jgi:hypothetical protein
MQSGDVSHHSSATFLNFKLSAIKTCMRHHLAFILFFILPVIFSACKKDKQIQSCFADAVTVREISEKKAVIRLTGTINAVWIIEQNTIDTRLIPCNFPAEFYQDGLQVTISGQVKFTPQTGPGPCCSENFIITKISR